MKNHKILVVMILYTTISLLITPGLIDSDFLVVINQQSATTIDTTNLSPSVKRYLETKWNEPISSDVASEVLKQSSTAFWSTPETRIYPPSIDILNSTEVNVIPLLGDSHPMPLRSTWPWQDETHQRKDFSATLRAPNMEGHYWLKRAYSTLSFETEIDEPIDGDVYIWIWLERYNDRYTRRFTIHFDGNYIDDFVIGSSGFKNCISVPYEKIDFSDSNHLVDLTINYCGYVERGWVLKYCWVGIGDGPNGYQQTPPMDDNSPNEPEPFMELVPRSGKTDTIVEYLVYCGERTILDIETENVNDGVTRVVDIYINDIYKTSILSPGSYYVQLGNIESGFSYVLKMVFRNMPDIDYPKKITQFAVHYVLWTLEIDWMQEVSTSTISYHLNAMNAWHKLHGYNRIDYTFSGLLTDDPITTQPDHNYYYWFYYEHKGWPYWEYVIWVNSLHTGEIYVAGWHLFNVVFQIDQGIAISSLHGHSTTIWHEYGHHIGIIELDGLQEVYCNNPKCVMSIYQGSYYCWFHWHQRSFY
ncbi:MAG: hypothetical protein RTU92_02660 [Candidatus Thorarchaeota archaeon]